MSFTTEIFEYFAISLETLQTMRSRLGERASFDVQENNDGSLHVILTLFPIIPNTAYLNEGIIR